MRKILVIFIFMISFNIYSQRKKVENIIFNEKIIPVTRIDYSQYGIAHFFITVTEDGEDNKVEENSIKCLNKEKNLYHTLYFFAKMPKEFSLEEKEGFLLELVNSIDNKEKIKDVNYFINLDSNFTKKLIERKSGLTPDNFRAFIDVNSKNVCKALSIR